MAQEVIRAIFPALVAEERHSRRSRHEADYKEKTAWLPQPTASIPITRPHLPPLEQFTELVAELFADPDAVQLRQVHPACSNSEPPRLLDHPAPLCVSSCDIGLTLAWQALECPPGEVIVPSFTFCSTVNALRWNGLEPVFADVDPETYCLDRRRTSAG